MSEYVRRELIAAPENLVSNGKINFGTFSSQFQKTNFLEAHNPLGMWLPRPFLNSRLKEWQAFQLGNNRWFLFVTLYSAKVSGLAQFIAYDKERKKKYIFEKVLPPWLVKVPGSLWNARQSYSDKNCFIEIVSRLEQGRFYINVKIKNTKNMPDTEAHFEAFHDSGLVQPIVVSIPFGENRGMYSHKCLMPMQGSMSMGSDKIEFARQESFAIIDDHKGFYPYEMRYDWVTAAAYDEKRRLIGFNLTDNQSIDPEKFNENCLWIDGKLNLLPAVKFDRPDGVEKDWSIRDKFGIVDLVFKPEVMGKIDMNMVFLKVKYRGPFGWCNGYIKDESGNKIAIGNYFGMGEEKYLRG